MDTRFLAAQREELLADRLASLDTLALWFMISWIVIITQGAIRKWMFPGLTIFYLVQDVPIAYAYIYAIRKGIVWVGGILYFSIFLGLLLAFQSFLQVIFIRYNLLSVLVALHHYLFYVPMLFLIPACMTSKNVQKFLRLNLYTIIPMCALATVQVLSPRDAWVNRTAAGDVEGQAFSVNGVIARSSGTFNFTLPFSVWCGVAAALVIGEWLLPPSRRAFRSRGFLIANSLAITVASMTSGSRTAVFLFALSFMGGIVGAFATRNLNLIVRFAGIMMLVPLFLFFTYMVAPTNVEALEGRFNAEGAHEEMASRIRDMSIGFLIYPNFTLLGSGMGAGIPAAETVGRYLGDDPYWHYNQVFISEWDDIRSVQGLGSVVGVFVVLARYGTCVLIMIAAFKALGLPGNQNWPHALPIAFTVIPTLAIGDMVHSAPIQAPQIYYCAALICSALLYRRERYTPAPLPLLEKAARA